MIGLSGNEAFIGITYKYDEGRIIQSLFFGDETKVVLSQEKSICTIKNQIFLKFLILKNYYMIDIIKYRFLILNELITKCEGQVIRIVKISIITKDDWNQ